MSKLAAEYYKLLTCHVEKNSEVQIRDLKTLSNRLLCKGEPTNFKGLQAYSNY